MSGLVFLHAPFAFHVESDVLWCVFSERAVALVEGPYSSIVIMCAQTQCLTLIIFPQSEISLFTRRLLTRAMTCSPHRQAGVDVSALVIPVKVCCRVMSMLKKCSGVCGIMESPMPHTTVCCDACESARFSSTRLSAQVR